MKASILRAVNVERRARRAVVVATDVADGSAVLVRSGEPAPDGLAEAVEAAFRSGRSATVQAGDRAVFLNVHLPTPRLVVIGAVHISQALAPMARVAGYPVEIVDPRTAFANPERFPEGEVFAEWPQTVFEARPLDPYCALAAVTHDPKLDDPALMAALSADCFYVGALGGRKSHAARAERLAALGATPEQIASVHGPIGLDIGAANPAEIAVSILAEVVGAFRSRRAAVKPSHNPA